MDDVKETFLKILSNYKFNDFLEYKDKGTVYKYSFEVKKYNDSLHVAFSYKKKGRISVSEIASFQSFLSEVNIKASQAFLYCTTIVDTNSLFFSKKLLPYFHNYEWSLRKLIYLVAPTIFSDWTTDSISRELRDDIEKRQKYSIKKTESNNILQWINLFDFEEYLFGENYITLTIKNEESTLRYKELEREYFLKLISEDGAIISKPFSLWNEVFSKYIDIDVNEIQLEMNQIRDGRNKVSHNKEVNFEDYKKLKTNLEKYIELLDEAFQKILIGEIPEEELNNMDEDFGGYIVSHSNQNDITGTSNNLQLNNTDIIATKIEIPKYSLVNSQNRMNDLVKTSENLTKSVMAPELNRKLRNQLNELTKTAETVTESVLAPVINQKLSNQLKELTKTSENLTKSVMASELNRELRNQLNELTKTAETVTESVIAPVINQKLSNQLKELTKTSENLTKSVMAPELNRELRYPLNELTKTAETVTESVLAPVINQKLSNQLKELTKISENLTKSVIVPEIYQEQSKRLAEIGKNARFIKKLKIPVIDQNIFK